MSYNKLFYNNISMSVDGNFIRVEPNFLCPVCKERPEHRFNQPYRFNANKKFDFNKQVTFTMPCCNTPITLNVAVHKEKDKIPCLYISTPDHQIINEWWVKI